MSIFARIRTVTLAYSNNLLDKAVDMNSLPVVRQYIRDLEDAINKTDHESAVAAANVTVLQSQITQAQQGIDRDTISAKAYLAFTPPDEAHARLLATRIHDSTVLLDSLKEQISQATSNSTAMDTALAAMKAKHFTVIAQLRGLESQERQARNLEGATSSLKAASSILSSNDVGDSVDAIGQKIHQRSAVASEEFNRAVGGFTPEPDPLKDAAVDDILAGLRPNKTA